MSAVEHFSFTEPHEVRTFPHGHADLLNSESGVVGRLVLEPGWKWSTDVKPIAGTEWCEAPHFQYHVSGLLRVRMTDGTEFEVGPGEVSALPSGHDAWVVGEEPVIVVDFAGLTDYARSA